ncbi:MAG TPA: VanZ family protein [Nitrospira sp.]|nr:VanZ family protein [Nitrospira sp.]
MGIEVSPKRTFFIRSMLKTGTIWFLLVVLAIAPIFPLSNFAGHPHWDQIRWIPFQNFTLSWTKLIDVVGNTLWFVVFGYLLHYQLNRDTPCRRTIATITAIAGAVSFSAEFFQVFCHNRISSMTDVACNVLGAGLGGYVAEKHPATTLIEPWLISWGSHASDQKRFNSTSNTCRQELPRE